ncbi:Ig-like domain-containing protein [Deinococcus marmoris]|uniref:Ig-like domain-containing protein n=1 Tax=Deinococcus marmoris TaxID=249408 RepID=UPI00096A7693|nr:Ig-like domain-containing protein [Deinococcus marmoris]
MPDPDLTAPTVVSITPANGAKGVSKNTKIVVTFSEKMNQAVTQAAYESTDLPADAVTFSWNTDGTVLTINPNQDLYYDSAAARIYAFKLTHAAQDVAGNALPLKSSSFKTFRMLAYDVWGTAALDGWVRGDGAVNTTSDRLRVGDGDASENNAAYRSFLSFDLSGLPAAHKGIESAMMIVEQTLIEGTPYTDLSVGPDALMMEPVNYGAALTSADFNTAALSSITDPMKKSKITNYALSVGSAVQADVSAGRTRSQYRLRFPSPTDGDGNADIVSLNSGENKGERPLLTVFYLMQ